MGRVYEHIANTADGVFTVDRRQKIVLWNEAATAILGYRSREVIEKSCYGILQGRDGEGCTVCRQGCDAIKAAEQLDLPPTRDVRVRTKRGEDVWINLSTVIIPSKDRELYVIVHLFREVSQQHDLARVAGELADVVSGVSDHRRSKPSEGAACVRLTSREQEILRYLVSGVKTDVIADRLCISPHTVRNHVANLLNKLGVHSRLEAVTYSIRNGIV